MNVPCGCNLVDNLITSYLYLWQMALFSSHVSNANFPLNCRPAAARSQTLPTTTDQVLHSANGIKTVIHTCVKSYKKKETSPCACVCPAKPAGKKQKSWTKGFCGRTAQTMVTGWSRDQRGILVCHPIPRARLTFSVRS